MEVIVLAGGLGTRLRSVIHEIPKCLAPIASASISDLAERASGWSVPPGAKKKADAPGGTDAPCGPVPFLQYLLDWLCANPVEHVVFSVGYLREQVISFVEGREWPFPYDFAVEETPLGTGGGIRLALGMCKGDHVFVVNGDTFYPVDLTQFKFDKAITLALKPMKDFDRYGTVVVSEGPTADEIYFSGRGPKNQISSAIATPPRKEESVSERPAAEGIYFSQGFAKNQIPSAIATPTHNIIAFKEKQHCEEGLINGGVYAIDRSRLDLSSLPERFSFEKEVLEPGAAIGEVGGVVSDAYFIDIGIPEDYGRAQWALPAWKAVKRVSSALMEASADTLFLDRDGVLNRHLPGDYVRTPAMWEWMPGVLEEFPRWAARFRRIVLVSNQRGVGKGVMSDEDLSRIHAGMMADILAAGGRLDLALYCTAVSDDDARRKPNTGMFLEAQQLFPDLDAESSVMVGDSPSDAAFAQNCGMQFILLSPEAVS